MSISAQDLRTIIRTCKASGVKKFKSGDLEIEFGVGETPKSESVSRISITPPTAEELQAAARDSALEGNAEVAEQQLSQMQIDDPVLYEQLILEREVVGSGSDPDAIPDDADNIDSGG